MAYFQNLKIDCEGMRLAYGKQESTTLWCFKVKTGQINEIIVINEIIIIKIDHEGPWCTIKRLRWGLRLH